METCIFINFIYTCIHLKLAFTVNNDPSSLHRLTNEKSSAPRGDNLPLNCYLGLSQQASQTTKAIILALSCPAELDYTTILLEIPHTQIKKSQVVTDQKASSLLARFTSTRRWYVGDGVKHHHQSYTPINPVNYNKGQCGKGVPSEQQ